MPDRPSAVSGALRRPFPEQVAFFRQKLRNLVPTARWDDIIAQQHDTAFVVAGAQKADLLADLAAAVDRAIIDGKSLDAFRKDFDAAVEANGWHGWTGEDSKGGRAWRTRTIYRTNASTSYAAGRRAQLLAGDFPFWIYRHGGSREPRPEHLDWDGLVLPPAHPFWSTHSPPSDWGCSCYVLGARSERAARRLGGNAEKRLPEGWGSRLPATGEPAGIGRGWGYAPGARVDAAVRAAVEKFAGWDVEAADAFLAELPESALVAFLAARARLAARLGGQTGAADAIISVNQLTEAQRNALLRYTGYEYEEVNVALRERDELVGIGVEIDAVLGRAAFPGKVVLYRGLRGEAADLIIAGNPEPGDVLRDKAFASTSRSADIGNQFRGSEEGGVLLRIVLQPGAKALDIATISKYSDEREVLVQRGTAMKVIGWDGERRILDVEIVG